MTHVSRGDVLTEGSIFVYCIQRRGLIVEMVMRPSIICRIAFYTGVHEFYDGTAILIPARRVRWICSCF